MWSRFRRIRPGFGSGVGQTLLSEPDKVDRIKAEMLAGNYRYESDEGRISGWRDVTGDYYIGEGHHRINAALEIYWESGDRRHLDRLLEYGWWETRSPPPKRRRLPTRSLWTRVSHYWGHYLGI